MALEPSITEFLRVRNYTKTLCAPLETEDFVPQPVFYASPPKWHLAHTTWFFEQFLLKPFVDGYQEFHPDFGFLFNSYYNNVGERTLRADRGNMTRPTVKEVLEYRDYVDASVKSFLNQFEELPKDISGIVAIGLNHEEQHQELMVTDLKFAFGHNPLFPIYQDTFKPELVSNTSGGFVTLNEGVYTIGYRGNGFSFDNEHGVHRVFCEEASISRSLVTNGEFIEFINSDGYNNFNLWLDEGWTWSQENNVKSPLYWHLIDCVWHHYTLSGFKKVDENDILAHVSYYEAAAYAEWKGMRLLTEFEWEAIHKELDWGARWEWTQSAYLPYPGFAKPEGAVGEYNGKFMVNQMVLRGASAATSKNHSRSTYRNFFHPHFQWQFTGIRLAKRQSL